MHCSGLPPTAALKTELARLELLLAHVNHAVPNPAALPAAASHYGGVTHTGLHRAKRAVAEVGGLRWEVPLGGAGAVSSASTSAAGSSMGAGSSGVGSTSGIELDLDDDDAQSEDSEAAEAAARAAAAENNSLAAAVHSAGLLGGLAHLASGAMHAVGRKFSGGGGSGGACGRLAGGRTDDSDDDDDGDEDGCEDEAGQVEGSDSGNDDLGVDELHRHLQHLSESEAAQRFSEGEVTDAEAAAALSALEAGHFKLLSQLGVQTRTSSGSGSGASVAGSSASGSSTAISGPGPGTQPSQAQAQAADHHEEGSTTWASQAGTATEGGASPSFGRPSCLDGGAGL